MLPMPEMSVWIILSLAIIAIIFNWKYWQLLFFTSLLLAIIFNVLDEIGILIIFSGIICAWRAQYESGWKCHLLHLFIALWAIALAAHLLPGFNNLLVLNHVYSGALSSSFSMNLNIDKPMLIFAFILLMPSMLKKPKHQNKWVLVISAMLILVFLPLLGYLMGLITVEFSLPHWIILFALNNLFITCVSEEVFFRGYLQNVLSRYGAYWSVIISGLLFGAAHFSGGLPFVILGSIAGICYGLIYLATGKLYLAILAHFSFNLYHLIFYTYPVYQSQ